MSSARLRLLFLFVLCFIPSFAQISETELRDKPEPEKRESRPLGTRTAKASGSGGGRGGGGADESNGGSNSPDGQGGAGVIPVYAAGAANHHPNNHHGSGSSDRNFVGLPVIGFILGFTVMESWFLLQK